MIRPLFSDQQQSDTIESIARKKRIPPPSLVDRHTSRHMSQLPSRRSSATFSSSHLPTQHQHGHLQHYNTVIGHSSSYHRQSTRHRNPPTTAEVKLHIFIVSSKPCSKWVYSVQHYSSHLFSKIQGVPSLAKPYVEIKKLVFFKSSFFFFRFCRTDRTKTTSFFSKKLGKGCNFQVL